MEHLKSIFAALRDWLPSAVILVVGIVVVWGAYRLLMRRQLPSSGSRIGEQLLIAAIAAVFVILVILEMPIADAARGQLLSLLGILITAAVALSSTTLLGNAMAGLMLRSIRNYRPGDFIVVEGHRGRVSELGLLRTEIQNERRDLTTLPNLYLVSNPVTVVRSSGTFVSATVSLGYDVARGKVEKCLIEAAEKAGLRDPFVFVLELGDFSIKYQVAGFLEEVKYLISAESKLREAMLDALHAAGIEIVSPTFMNQRQLGEDRVFIPKIERARKEIANAMQEPRPEERMFDKAELAESEAKIEEQLKDVLEQIEKAKKNEVPEADKETVKALLERLEAQRSALEAELERRRERKDEADEAET